MTDIDTAIAYYEEIANNFEEYKRIHCITEYQLKKGSQSGQIAEWLKELKQLREHTRWIPVSERLPEDRNWHLGIFKESDTGWINPLPFICDYVGHETKATTKEHWILRGFTDRDEHIDYYFNLECVAWMPFLESYKVESEG